MDRGQRVSTCTFVLSCVLSSQGTALQHACHVAMRTLHSAVRCIIDKLETRMWDNGAEGRVYGHEADACARAAAVAGLQQRKVSDQASGSQCVHTPDFVNQHPFCQHRKHLMHLCLHTCSLVPDCRNDVGCTMLMCLRNACCSPVPHQPCACDQLLNGVLIV